MCYHRHWWAWPWPETGPSWSSWLWLSWTWGKLLATSHRSYSCSPPPCRPPWLSHPQLKNLAMQIKSNFQHFSFQNGNVTDTWRTVVCNRTVLWSKELETSIWGHKDYLKKTQSVKPNNTQKKINIWWMQGFDHVYFQWNNQLLTISHSPPSNTHNISLFLSTIISSVFQQSSCSGRSTIHGEFQSDSPSWIEAIILRLIMTLLNYSWKHNLTSLSKLVKKQNISCLPHHLVSSILLRQFFNLGNSKESVLAALASNFLLSRNSQVCHFL